MTDSNGMPVPREASYAFKMTAAPVGGAFAAQQVTIKSFAEGSLYPGYAFLMYVKRDFFHGQYEATDQELMERLDSYIFFADLFGPDPAGTRHVLNDEIFFWESNDQKTNILESIKRRDVGHVFYTGHGNVDQFGGGDDTTVTTSVYSTDLKNTLTNDFNVLTGVYNFRNPKRYVEIDGCNTSTGFLPLAFGIPKINIDRKPNIARRSFIGWNGLITYGWYATEYQQYVDDQNYIWHDVEGGPIPIREAVRLAIIASNYEVDINEVGLYGSRLLTWAVNTP